MCVYVIIRKGNHSKPPIRVCTHVYMRVCVYALCALIVKMKNLRGNR